MKQSKLSSTWLTVFIAMVVAVSLWSCTDSDYDDLDSASEAVKGNAFIQLVINTSGTGTTRSSISTTEGTSSESNITDLKAVLTDGSTVKQVIDFDIKSSSDSTQKVTEVENVDAGIYYIYVLANYDACNLSTISVGDAFDGDNAFTVSSYTGVSCPLANGDKFLMTNDSNAVGQTTLYKATASNSTYLSNELDSVGTVMTDGDTLVNVIEVNVERAVAKVTTSISGLDTNSSNFTITDAYGNEQVITKMDSVALTILNSQAYLFRHQLDYSDEGVTTLAYDDLYYAEDPNFEFSDEALDSLESVSTWNSPFFVYEEADVKEAWQPSSSTQYCLENTMAADYQRKGLSTCLIFQATIGDPVYTKLYTSDASTTLNSYEKEYTETFLSIVNCSNDSIATTLFETKEDTDAEGTFYVYNNLLFISEAAARMYKAIVTHQDEASEATKLWGYYKADATTFDCYEGGNMYYTHYIKHNTASDVDNEFGKYGVVRNHWYSITVTGVDGSSFGEPDPTPYTPGDNPDDPDDGDGDDPIDSSSSTKLQVSVTINAWRNIVEDEVVLSND